MTKNFLSIVLCICLTACGEQKIVNKINLVHAIGFDTAGKNVKGTVLMGDYKKKGEADVELLDTESNSEFDMMPRLNTKTKEPIEYGQLGTVLFGKSYSQKGIKSVIENMCGDPKISTRMQLAVTDKDASEILDLAKKSKDPFFLSEIIEQNIKKGNLPSNNLQKSLFNYYEEGRDLFLPHFMLERGKVKIDGLALFRKDKYITKINIKDALLLKLLIENSKNGSYMVPATGTNPDHEDYILLNIVNSKVKYKLNKMEPIPSIAINVIMGIQLKYVPNKIDFNSKEQISQYEKSIGIYFEQELQKLISLCKKNSVDPIGLSNFIRSKTKEWNTHDFQKMYSELETNVSVKLNIVHPGFGQ